MHYRIISLPEILYFICPLTHRPLFQVPIDQVFPFSLLGLCKENPSCLGILQESSSEVFQQLQNCHQRAFKSLSPGNYYSHWSILSAFSFFTYQLVRIRVWNSFAGHKTAQDRLNFDRQNLDTENHRDSSSDGTNWLEGHLCMIKLKINFILTISLVIDG